MLARLRTVLALASTFAVLTACGGGSHSTLPVATPNGPGTGPQNSFRSTGFVYDAGFVAKSHLIAPAHFGTLALNVVLPMRDPSGLTAYANSVSDPKSANYRQFLTPVEIANRFAATASDQTAAAKYFAGLGLQVGGWKQRMLLRVVGTQAQLETAFRTKFGTFQSPQGLNFLAPMKTPSVPAGVPVVGSADIVVRPKRFVSTLVPATGTTAGYAPQQIARAFDYDGAYAAGYTGAGITVGIIGTGGIQTTGGGRVGDADAYKALYHIGGASTVSIVAATPSDPVVNSASGFAPPPPVTGPCATSGAPGLPPSESPTATCNPEDGESQLDTEQAASLARDSAVQFFLAYNPNDACPTEKIGSPCPAGTGYPLQGLAESDEELQTAIDNDSADVLSLSFGGDEYQSAGPPVSSPPAPFTTDGSGLDPTELKMLVAEGTAVFVASGDSGAEGCQPFASAPNPLVDLPCVSYPSTDPSAVAVGGVTTPLNAAGQFVGPVTVWGQQTSGGFESGSGGGVSAYFPQPPYQQGLPGITGQNRNVPDLSLEGDPRTGVALLRYADRSSAVHNSASRAGRASPHPRWPRCGHLYCKPVRRMPPVRAKAAERIRTGSETRIRFSTDTIKPVRPMRRRSFKLAMAITRRCHTALARPTPVIRIVPRRRLTLLRRRPTILATARIRSAATIKQRDSACRSLARSFVPSSAYDIRGSDRL